MEDCAWRGAPPICSLSELATTPADEFANSGWKLVAEACNVVVGIYLTNYTLQPGNELLWAPKTQSLRLKTACATPEALEIGAPRNN